MKLQNTHSEKNHLFKKPHKWFLRLLSSPIRFAELHYKKKYHLRFRHARKLFIFDIALLIIIILTACTTIFWLSYDPSITKLVYLSIEPSSDRIISGEYKISKQQLHQNGIPRPIAQTSYWPDN